MVVVDAMKTWSGRGRCDEDVVDAMKRRGRGQCDEVVVDAMKTWSWSM